MPSPAMLHSMQEGQVGEAQVASSGDYRRASVRRPWRAARAAP